MIPIFKNSSFHYFHIMASTESDFAQKAYPNLKINVSARSNKRNVSFLGDDAQSEDEDSGVPFEEMHLQMTILNPPRKKRKLSHDVHDALTQPEIEEVADYGDLEEDITDEHGHRPGAEDVDLNHNAVHREEPTTNDTGSFKDFEDNDSITIAKAIKIIQQQQVQSLGLFEKLLHEKSTKTKNKKAAVTAPRDPAEGEREKSVTPQKVYRPQVSPPKSASPKSPEKVRSIAKNTKRVPSDFEYIAPQNDADDEVKFRVVI